MATAYELYNTAGNNVVGAYPTRDAALAVVRRAHERYGFDGIKDLALIVQDSLGRVRTLASGGSLLLIAAKARVPHKEAIPA